MIFYMLCFWALTMLFVILVQIEFMTADYLPDSPGACSVIQKSRPGHWFQTMVLFFWLTFHLHSVAFLAFALPLIISPFIFWFLVSYVVFWSNGITGQESRFVQGPLFVLYKWWSNCHFFLAFLFLNGFAYSYFYSLYSSKSCSGSCQAWGWSTTIP